MAKTDKAPSAFKRWAAVLWPLGGTVFGILVVPIAIAQYPEFFSRNALLLPLSLAVVVFCWIVPLLFHDRIRRLSRFVWGFSGGGRTAALLVVLTIIGLGYLGCHELFRFHQRHLQNALEAERQSHPEAQKQEGRSSTTTVSPLVSFPHPDMDQIKRALRQIEKNTESRQASVPAGPEFAVNVEYAFMTVGSREHGTSFWVSYGSPPNCSLSPVHAALFIRITNLKEVSTMITAYTLKWGGKLPLVRLRTEPGHVFWIVPPNKMEAKPPLGPRDVQIRLIQGPGLFSWLSFVNKEADTSRASLLDLNLLDTELGNTYIEPHHNVRGWAFFEYPADWPPPTNLRMSITDELGKTGSYDSSLKNGDPSGDLLPRTFTVRGVVDMSSCSEGYGSP